jgi:hypothetical protein
MTVRRRLPPRQSSATPQASAESASCGRVEPTLELRSQDSLASEGGSRRRASAGNAEPRFAGTFRVGGRDRV